VGIARLLPTGHPDPRPSLRGVVHAWSLVLAVVGGAVLTAFAPDGKARLSALIYVVCIGAMFGISALYHRRWWRTARARQWMRRLDHSGIFLAIAGTYTPFALLVLDGLLATVVLLVIWIGGLVGIAINLAWMTCPRWVTAVIYGSLGWVGVISFPQMVSRAGVVVSALVLVGGILYSLGAVVYARKRPDPVPHVFGYHEVFHALVTIAAVTQFAAVAQIVVD
jgi:hemolysin III